MRAKKRLGKTHWKESRKENGNLNQKAGPMISKKDRKLRTPVELSEDDDFPVCQGCGCEISYSSVVDFNSYCEVCYSISGEEYEDTLEDETIPEPKDPSPTNPFTYNSYTNEDLDVPKNKPRRKHGDGDPR